jgi:glycosyltransferase involved in cell wall biosynthesis
VEQGVTGFLTPAGQAENFAAALEQLLINPQLRNQLGAAARKRAERLFSVEAQVDRLLGLWSEILNRPQP